MKTTFEIRKRDERELLDGDVEHVLNITRGNYTTVHAVSLTELHFLAAEINEYLNEGWLSPGYHGVFPPCAGGCR